MRLHGIDIPASDIERAYRFYADVLEFPIVGRFGNDMAMFFLGDVHGGMVRLVKTQDPPAGQGPCLLLAAQGGVETVRARLEGQGVRFLGPTGHSPLGRLATFLDSEGNCLALFENTVTGQFRKQAAASNAEQAVTLSEREAALRELLAGMSEAQAAFRPAPGEWPILGHLGHIIDTLDSCGVVAHDLASGREPPHDRLLEKEYPVESLRTALSELGDAFGRAREWLARLDEGPGSGATLTHGVFGGLNDREWVGFMLFHIRMHSTQITEIKSSAGYPAG